MKCLECSIKRRFLVNMSILEEITNAYECLSYSLPMTSLDTPTSYFEHHQCVHFHVWMVRDCDIQVSKLANGPRDFQVVASLSGPLLSLTVVAVLSQVSFMTGFFFSRNVLP